jgi:hypothetical protein
MNTTVRHDPDDHGIRELFDWAADLPADQWEPFLARECPDDPARRAAVLRILKGAQQASAEQFLKRPREEQPAADPEAIGKYRVVRRLSEAGGQATAYLAYDPDTRRHVVLKRYHPADTPDDRRALYEEAQALARIDSDYVAQCFGIERLDDEVFLVVQYIPGRNLEEIRRDSPLDPNEVVRLVTELAEGVAAVHACWLIHRDIKPANVIRHENGKPRLVDFGLAAFLGSDRSRELSGTPAYMAPEQARVESDRIDSRTDIFGIGGVLYYLLTGHPPYEGATRAEVLERAKKHDIPPPRSLEPTIPAALESVCLKALAAAPGERYATAGEFAAALRKAAEPEPVPATGPARRPDRMRRRLLVAVGCGLLALAGWYGAREPVSAIVARPLQANISVNHFRELGDGRRVRDQGPITADSLARNPPHLKDSVRVHVELTRPAHVLLIALNPDGKDQLCAQTGDDTSATPTRELEYPEDRGRVFGLTDGAGLQAFVVVASERPLPAYAEWKGHIPGGLAWSPVEQEGFWTYDATASADIPRIRGRLRGEILQRDVAPEGLVNLCNRLREAPGVTLVQAVAFPVKPDQDIMR